MEGTWEEKGKDSELASRFIVLLYIFPWGGWGFLQRSLRGAPVEVNIVYIHCVYVLCSMSIPLRLARILATQWRHNGRVQNRWHNRAVPRCIVRGGSGAVRCAVGSDAPRSRGWVFFLEFARFCIYKSLSIDYTCIYVYTCICMCMGWLLEIRTDHYRQSSTRHGCSS